MNYNNKKNSITSKKTNNEELLRQYQTEAEDIRTRKLQEKSNKITEERQQQKLVNDQLDQESQTRIQNKQNYIIAQRQDYERFMTEKSTRHKSGDFRKKTSEPQGTFKIGGESREIKHKHKDDFESDLPLNPTKNAQIPTQPLYENLASNANVLQQNRNRNQGYDIISGQASQVVSSVDYRRSENNDDYANNYNNNYNNNYGQMKTETPKLKHNVQTKANNASYNPISHTDNSNYYSNSVSTNDNQRTNANAKVGNIGGNNKNYNIINNNNFGDDGSNNINRKNVNVNNNNINNFNKNINNQRAENLQNEEEYENFVSRNANKDYAVHESEGNEYEQAEKYKNLTDEEKRKLYEEYMRKFGPQNENEEENYNQRAYGKHQGVNYLFFNFKKFI